MRGVEFVETAAREFFADWERAADDIVAVLRSTAGKNPYDKDLTDLIGELSTRSEEFRTRAQVLDGVGGDDAQGLDPPGIGRWVTHASSQGGTLHTSQLVMVRSAHFLS